MSLEKLKTYYSESAARAMISDFPVCRPNQSVEEARSYILEGARHFETINYIYVIGDDKKLLGTVSLRELFQAEKERKISGIMKTGPVFLHPHSDQEKAVLLALHNNIKAVPVVDQNHILLGIIPSDKILQILHSEHVEDLLRVAGITKSIEEVAHLGKESSFKLFGRRIPSLLIGLFAGIVAAWWISSFEHMIEAEFLFVAFIPAVVYLSDAVGTQTQILFIRDMTFAELFRTSSYIIQELKVGLLISIALSMLFIGGGFLMGGSVQFAAILVITVVLSVFAAMAVSLFVPWLLIRLKHDPALASGPFSTAVSDVFSLVIYFTVASVILNLFS
ncbi:MAG: hypothetical protein A3G49_02300 [Candidatus Sungbacteria bacterium RIFCSPLOWO2_12_FULL_41_11]|uniref:CBS domain-containing protein n=1 Tax=Candidatus Sungbacteria bacterium RIFCSPLOWO2_12_FULL_41_11 TaxID=1802286 RepID=A0A1G2LNL6_9BACT|nr:MAG: Mg2+ transporter [Parcubacteria group bacterium GW2011_GWA2_42_14]OGZ97215.1 MAG: hypothetical protein A3D41_00200 [Candidatus Sungbacteria bacterium RIFCSPHIGHO2_02_FULL_41_12b]OHA13173.1 MAG: hypothetical protein A3G49_02300 [Candidatus Sungbacteria bacterium RIFCSPLOWO2_12_FULL_41_11]